jgi:hypothetical protein
MKLNRFEKLRWNLTRPYSGCCAISVGDPWCRRHMGRRGRIFRNQRCTKTLAGVSKNVEIVLGSPAADLEIPGPAPLKMAAKSY